MYRVYWMDGSVPRTVLLTTSKREARTLAIEMNWYARLTVYVERVR